MNENVNVKTYEIDQPLIHKIDSIVDNCFRDCHNKYFHTFDHICEYDIILQESLIMKQLNSQFLIRT